MKDTPSEPGRRRLFAHSIPVGASLVAGLANVDASRAAEADSARARSRVSVTDFGAVGDGETPSAEAFQRAIDTAESAGGGIVEVPPGTFILERTPLIASRVHLLGTGRASVLRGERPDANRGAALISNKGQQADGYEGASDWSISHIAIDSPKTNGIVITHAARVYLGWIHGIEAYHHFVDNVGCDVMCENLFLTGRSGTSTFQIDSLAGAQTIWDGQQAVAPNYDGTEARNLILRDSFITAKAGHAGDNPEHYCSLHFHGDRSAGFMFSNLVLGGAPVGIYQDAGSHYEDIQIDNLRSTNPRAAALFNGGATGQRGLIIRGLMHVPCTATENPLPEVLVEGHDDVMLIDSRLIAAGDADSTTAISISGCHNVRIAGVQARASAGTAIEIDQSYQNDRQAMASTDISINGCHFQGFDIGICASFHHRRRIISALNLFSDVGLSETCEVNNSLAEGGGDQRDKLRQR